MSVGKSGYERDIICLRLLIKLMEYIVIYMYGYAQNLSAVGVVTMEEHVAHLISASVLQDGLETLAQKVRKTCEMIILITLHVYRYQ